MSMPMAIALSGHLLFGQPLMVKPSKAEKNLVQTNASGGGSVVGSYIAVDRKLYVGNLHFSITVFQLRQEHSVAAFTRVLDEASVVLFFRDKVYLHPDKDKWRNMGISTAAHSSKEKIRIPRVKAITAGPLTNGQNSASASLIDDDKDGKTAPRYNAMIFEALTAIKDSNGADISAILNFIERRHEVPQNFRRSLSSKLRRLVLQGKLEKVQNCYKIKRPAMLGTKTPTPKQKDIRSRPPQNSGLVITRETVEEAARTTARKVAEAENKSSVAAEAVREAERITKMAEENELMLQFVKEIYDQCSLGEVLLLA